MRQSRGNLSQPEPPKYFAVKKYLLVGVIVLNTLALFFVIFSLDSVADRVVKQNYRNLTANEFDDVKATMKGLLFGVSFGGVLVEFLFLYGIIKEHLCLSISYALLAILSTIFLAIATLSNPLVGLEAIFCACVSIVAMLFVLDLGRFRQINQRLNNFNAI